jgi:hypothetical protein
MHTKINKHPNDSNSLTHDLCLGNRMLVSLRGGGNELGNLKTNFTQR